MNRFEGIARFFKVYSLPLLTIVVAFGLYYAVFEAAHLLKVSPKPAALEHIAITKLPEPAVQNDVPLTLPEPEAPLPQEPHAPNLMQIPASSPNDTPLAPSVSDSSLPDTPVAPTSQPPEESSPFSLRFIVNTDVLNIREAPSINAPIVTKKYRSEVLLVNEIENEWVRTSEGWAYLRLLRSGFDEPVRFIVNTDILNIREAPSLSAPIIERRGRAETLLVSEIESEWGRIPKGWVYIRLLTPAP